MEATSTIDLRPATSSEMRAYDRHVEHDPAENHDNKMIVQSDRELNVYHQLADENDALEDQYGSYLAERDAKLESDFKAGKISTDQYTSRKQTVQEYVNGSNGSKEKKAYTSGVLTVADGDTQRDMLDKLGWDYQMIGVGDQNEKGEFEHYRPQLTNPQQRETWSRLWDMTYTQTAKDLSNSAMRAVSVTTNLDEGGGAHAHVKFVNMGQTDKGKPSTTMNGALKAMYGGKDSRENLRKFREEADPLMIANFNKAAEVLGLNLHLDMIRTRKAGSADMPTYKANKKHEAELKKQAEQNRKDAEQNRRDAENNRTTQNAQAVAQRELDRKEAEYQEKMKMVKMREREAEEAKSGVVDTIAQYNPEHFVHSLPRDEAEPVTTQIGRQQHMRQTMAYLKRVMDNAIRMAAQRLVKMNQRVKQNLDLAQAKQDLQKPQNGGTPKPKDDGPDF